jgi:hypothetical protein
MQCFYSLREGAPKTALCGGCITMSEELEQLRQYLETGQRDAAFGLLDEMDEMSRDDKIRKIQSYMHVLLIHLALHKKSGQKSDSAVSEDFLVSL